MKSSLFVSSALLATALAGPALAQAKPSPWSISEALGLPDDVTLSGSSRLRFESIDGQVRPGFNDSDTLVSLRTTLLAEYRAGPVRIGAEIYDSRAYGADSGTPISTNEVNTFEPVQAYVAVDLSEPVGPGSKATLQAGRFTLNLGSRRLVAADDYRNTTNGYTGLRGDLSWGEGWKATAIWVAPQVRRPDDFGGLLDNDFELDRESGDLVLWGGLVGRAKTIGEATLEGGFFHLEEQDAPGRPTRDRSLDSFSLRIVRDPAPGRWDFEIEVIGQGGELSASTAPAAPLLDVRAGFVHADLGFSFEGPWKARLSAEFDYASGDEPGGEFSRFDTLFGMRRADLAPAGLYNAIGRANIVTPGLRFEVAPTPRLDAFVAWRGLWLASEFDSFSTTGVRDPAGLSGRYAGQQVEGRLRYWLVPDALRFEANAVYLAKGRFLERAPNATGGGDSLYLSLNLTAYF